MGDRTHVAPLALMMLALAALVAWELRLWHVRRGVRAGRVRLVSCSVCGRRVPRAWPRVTASATCAVCARTRARSAATNPRHATSGARR
jgi:hypothetical protein